MQAALNILVPACNESDRILPTLVDYCEHFGERATVTVIANGCTDNTVHIVEQLMERYANLHLLLVNGKIGKGGAVRAGLKAATAEYVALADADGSTTGFELDRIFKHCTRTGVDACIGSRWLTGAVVHPRQPFLRRLASRAFNAITKILFSLRFTDTQCGAKVFRRKAVKTILNSLEVADFAFDIEVLWRLQKHGFSIDEIPTVWADRAAGTKVRLLATSLKMLKTIVRMRLRDTILWRLPFLDCLGRSSVIPVKNGPSVLLLAPPSFYQGSSLGQKWVADCVRHLMDHGCTVIASDHLVPFRQDGDVRYWMRFWRWYACESRREYDAIVEVASPVPALITAVSMKRRFLCAQERALSPIARFAYRVAYCRIDGHFSTHETPAMVARTLMERIGAGALYRAAFREVDGAWALGYSDLESGAWTVQSLK